MAEGEENKMWNMFEYKMEILNIIEILKNRKF